MKELFFELGLEELPARLVRRALNELKSSLLRLCFVTLPLVHFVSSPQYLQGLN